jgi:hypothetical protein
VVAGLAPGKEVKAWGTHEYHAHDLAMLVCVRFQERLVLEVLDRIADHRGSVAVADEDDLV